MMNEDNKYEDDDYEGDEYANDEYDNDEYADDTLSLLPSCSISPISPNWPSTSFMHSNDGP